MRTPLRIATICLPVIIAVSGIGVSSSAESPVTAPATSAARTTAPVGDPTLTGISVAPVPDNEVIRTSLTPDVRVSGASAAQRDELDEALERFRRERLALPDLDVHFFDDEAQCQGHLGLFTSSMMPWRASICSDLPFVLTHELAHAWTAANLDDADRDAYLAARGLPAWSSQQLEWHERGVEDAAFVIQQNLMAGTVRADSPTWVQRMAAYEQLTERPSPLRRSQTDSAAVDGHGGLPLTTIGLFVLATNMTRTAV